MIIMKLIKVYDKKVGETTYYKYRINIPKKIVELAQLIDKDLEVRLDGEKIIIQKINKEEKQHKKKLTKKEKIIQKELMKIMNIKEI